ncbi:MAG: DUF998 domain-containing protein [Promethearchaeota archaeon]
MESNKKSVLFTFLSFICIIIFFIIVLLFHLFRTDHDPLLQTMSEYTIGPYGIFFPIALLILSLSSFLSYMAICESLPKTRLTKNSMKAFLLWTIFITITGLFPTDLITGPYSFSGVMHGVSSYFAFLSLPFAHFFLPLSRLFLYLLIWFHILFNYTNRI